jgi:hypothetical protein
MSLAGKILDKIDGLKIKTKNKTKEICSKKWWKENFTTLLAHSIKTIAKSLKK